jgi:hypothetical protein
MVEDFIPESKQDLLNVIHSEKEKLDSILEGLPESRMVEPAFGGNWSIKDTLAHITAWERIATEIIQTAQDAIPLNPEIPEIFKDIDSFNAKTFETHRHRILDEVLQEFQEMYDSFLAHIGSLQEKFIFSNLPFKGVEDLTIQQIISSNTHWHYKEHREDIQKWLTETDRAF